MPKRRMVAATVVSALLMALAAFGAVFWGQVARSRGTAHRYLERASIEWPTCLGGYQGVDRWTSSDVHWDWRVGRKAELVAMTQFEHGTAMIHVNASPTLFGWEVDDISFEVPASARCDRATLGAWTHVAH